MQLVFVLSDKCGSLLANIAACTGGNLADPVCQKPRTVQDAATFAKGKFT
jgi:hypothetical protein